MRLQSTTIAVLLLVSSSWGCQSPYYRDRGAGFGAIAGGLTGAAIGENNGNAAAGALIGGAVGAATGAVVGDVIDTEVARNNQIIQQQLGRDLARAATMQDVIAMTRAGVGDEVILNHIRAYGVSQRPQAADVISMHQQGVSNTVINAMQNASGPRAVVAPASATVPVVVEEHYFGPGYYYPPPLRYRRLPPRYCGPGVSWGVSFSN